MIRAIFFDFYGVWVPNTFANYLNEAQQIGTQIAADLAQVLERYFHGEVDASYVATSFRMKLQRVDIDDEQFKFTKSNLSPQVITYLRNLHSHFFKVGVLANLGVQEKDVLTSVNLDYNLLEVIASPLSFGLAVPLLSPEVFDQALRAIGEPTRSTLVVSADADYLQFAASLGIATVPFAGFPALQQTIDRLISEQTP